MAADNVVSIDIMVRDGGTLSVLDTTGAKLKTLEASAAGASREVQGVGASFGTVGSGVEVMGRATQGTESLRGSLREVRGEARELGVNLGYSMTHFLAQSPAVMTFLRSMEGIFLGIAAIDIAGQAIEGLHAFYEKFIDVGHAIDEYRKKAGEAAETRLFETSSIETTVALLRQVKDEIDAIEAKKNDRLGEAEMRAAFGPAAPVAAWGMQKVGLHSPMFTGEDAEVEVKNLQNQATAQQRLREQTHEEAVQQIEERQKYNSVALEGLAKIGAAQQTANEKAAENFRYTQQNEQALHDTAAHIREVQEKKHVSPDLLINVPVVDPNAGWQKYVDESTEANRQAQAERIAMARQETEQEIHMRAEAIEAGMTGEALYDHQRTTAEDAITQKMKDGTLSRAAGLKEIEDLDMKFHNAKMERLEEEQNQTTKIQQQAQLAGAATLPKLQMQTQFNIEDMTTAATKAGLPDDQVQARRKAMEQQGDAEILHARQEFTQKITELTEHSTEQMTSGLAQVAAREQNSLTELGRAYTEFYGADQAKWQGYQDAKTAIEQGAERERQKLAEDIDRQIAQTEAEAARSLLPPWQAAQQKIEDDYRQRLEKIREDVEQHVVTEEQGAREVQAAWALANSEMERATMQERDRLASQLASFFDNPAKYMQQRAKQVMFDIMANWMQQLEQNNPRMQGAIGAMFGLNQVGTGSPQHALGQLFGAHSATHDQSGLTNASSTLISAGSTLSASGTMLASSAAALTQAATVWESALYNQSSGGGAGGGSFSGWTGESSSSGAGSDSFWLGGGGSGGGGGIFGGGGASPSFGGAGGAGGGSGTAELSEVLGIPPQLASMIPGGNAIGSTLGLYQGFSKLFSSSGTGSGAQLLNPSGGFQPSDINQAPTNSAGVLGTVPGGAASDDNGSTGSGALGEIGGVVSGGMTAYSGLSAAWNSSNVGSGLIGAGETALGGAEIGMTVGGPMGAIIGGITGFAAGLTADLIGDHGLSKARHYNTMTVEPALQQLMYEDYDSAMLGMNNLQIQAQKQTAQWGSGAAEYYHSTILPEITNAEAQVTREGRAGRDNVTTSAAQFHGGGWVSDFLDLATSDTEGFIHARQGEYMMHDAAASTNAPWLEAMNRGLDLTSALAPALAPGGAVPRETNAASDYASSGRSASTMGAGGGSGSPVHVHVHALDSKDVNRWLREGGAMQIQTHLNRNTARYSGKALSS